MDSLWRYFKAASCFLYGVLMGEGGAAAPVQANVEAFDLRNLAGRVAFVSPPRTTLADQPPRGVWTTEDDGDHIFFSQRLQNWVWARCDAYTGWQYSAEWNLRHFIRENSWLLISSTEKEEGDESAFDLAVVDHCFSNVYWGLHRWGGLPHLEALAEADECYLEPLVRIHLQRKWGVENADRKFVLLSSFDLGRVDFPRTAALITTLTVLSFNGALDWLHKSRAFYFPMPRLDPGPCEETGEWRQPLRGLDWQVQDTVLPIPCRHAWDPAKSASNDRPLLGFFAGSLNSCSRQWLFSLFGSTEKPSSVGEMVAAQAVPGHVWVFNGSLEGPASPPDTTSSDEILYQDILWASHFCLVLNGSSSVNNARLIETISHGCIPVVISDDFQPPFHNDLRWLDAAVFLRTREIPLLPQILLDVAQASASTRRLVLAEMVRFLDTRQPHFWNTLWGAALRGVQTASAMKLS